MKVTIIGGAPGWKEADFNAEHVWVLGNQMDRYQNKRVTRIFEVHENLSEHDKIYPQWLINHNIPLVVSDQFPKCLHSIIFNYDKARQLIGENFSSTPSVMMAQAVLDGAKEIDIYGIDMALDEHEYFMQRPCMEQWIGYAKGLGIKVTIHDSPLGYTTYREGRDWPDKGFTGYDENEYQEMAQYHQKEMDKMEFELAKLMATQDRCTELKAKFQGHDGARQVYKRLAKLQRAKDSGLDVQLEVSNG